MRLKFATVVMCAMVTSITPAEDSSASRSIEDRVRVFEEGLRPAARSSGESAERWSLEQRMKHHQVPGMSVAVLQDGDVAWAKGYGVTSAGATDPIDEETVFSIGSLSKTGTAVLALRLVAAGQLQLDADVNESLTSWKVPDNKLTENDRVTLRRLLSHTAGTSVHGFADYLPHQKLPTIVQTLDGVRPAMNRPIRVVHRPGSTFDYSGGGTTIVELLVRDVTGASLHAAAQQHLFEPLGMQRSAYLSPLPKEHGNIAKAHNSKGKPTALPRGWEAFPEAGASGLWTTPSEYARMLAAVLSSYHGRDDSFLPQAIAREMLTEVLPSTHGLGPRLDGRGTTRRMSHGGSNRSYKAIYSVLVRDGNGAVVFTNGANGAKLIAEVMRALSDAFEWGTHDEIEFEPLPPSHLEKLAGLYRIEATETGTENRNAADAPKIALVKVKDGELLLVDRSNFPEIAEDPLYPIDPLYFSTGEPGMRIEFLRNSTSRIVGMKLHEGRRGIVYKRVTDPIEMFDLYLQSFRRANRD